MKVTLVRHGETEENKKNLFQGHLQGNLSSLGISQAKDVAEKLSDMDIDLIISSDLDRAYDTAKEIVKFHDEISIEKSELLRERYFGDLQGKSGFNLDIPNNSSLTSYVEEHNGETGEHFLNRAREVLDSIERKIEGEIVLVSHCGTIKAILKNILDESPEEMKKIKLENASITSLEFDDGEWNVLRYNDIEHLTDKNVAKCEVKKK